MESCQKKYCPYPERKQLEQQMQQQNALCFKYKTMKKRSTCVKRTYDAIAPSATRHERCIRKHCKRPLQTQNRNVRAFLNTLKRKK